ncbi:cupin domain-containing protein [Bosea sp. BK604]|uniref:cupin domain-containing protein n=1 Tax=Bosea sp. BK604 TaxID=2512180 RepID=UPI0010495A4A|nr:cupin domain-containing protein [Bosea sp. BK604]TCR68736.1 oxalate decarboxylase [Bosea sp. BK604]
MVAVPHRSKHVFQLGAQEPRFKGPKGSIAHMDAGELPLLKGLSLRRLRLAPQGVREPHWHANAHELGYCLGGEALVTIAGNHSSRESFTIGRGEMFFVPSGAMHSIENIADGETDFVLAFSHEQPEDFGIAASFAAMTDAVLGNTYGLATSAFRGLDRKALRNEVYDLSSLVVAEGQALHANALRYPVEATPPQIDFPAGTAHLAKVELWPALRDISMFSVRISDQGMREPHWHPETAEMGYVAQGQGRMTILDPDGSTDTYLLGPGDAYFIQRAYPHHIENIGEETFHALIFFDRPSPGDIGYKSLASCFPRDVLAGAFGMNEADLPRFPFTALDPLLVPRVNPIDPIA